MICFKGKHKLDDKWEQPVYVVLSQVPGELPVYSVRPEDQPKVKIQTLHRNHLLPLVSLPLEESVTKQPQTMKPVVAE